MISYIVNSLDFQGLFYSIYTIFLYSKNQMGWRGKRRVPVNKVKVKELKLLLKNCKNSTEQKRIQIMVVYLWWKDSSITANILNVSKQTVQNTIDRYMEDEDNFYKTNYKWKIETKERKKLKLEVKELVEEWIEKEKFHDINGILRTINKRYDKEVTNYHWMRWIIREALGYNYQKPFVRNKKKPEYAKEIIKGRLTKAIIKVWLNELDVDSFAIKNKKTKFWEIIV